MDRESTIIISHNKRTYGPELQAIDMAEHEFTQPIPLYSHLHAVGVQTAAKQPIPLLARLQFGHRDGRAGGLHSDMHSCMHDKKSLRDNPNEYIRLYSPLFEVE